ncbi:uncharacterized protein LOC133338795 isoform X2 [Musca vetustissima]|uniref:uncharacterized protein LOC133322374 isoform X2 n=1 Tax=Musca vetustissima TaxID=27455 RepID=UPI002AB6EA27|nr:uncharacterized protein LOC133322374 isoform X2 [Musca vetustissima]XP_061388855.1 uncharacterized protein LOC133323969 isoform X2 [Musca vetustissima]XP_061390314.1 uncharacterized protein LOC133325591 isoform X2 [Musca vetustissima]XP_061390904.1 uncharacterized protein LOC133326239 isoform X2 [Musca vetustissima]XP_061391446.1 uncharacterized protein LOC133326856 isoform X2 [Musca vetustissima]XP_061395834.1 uncharacterized protein LOC133331459 isoform X2 [Musca vetustissima]XP_06140059
MEGRNLKHLNTCNRLSNYSAKETPCCSCIELKEMMAGMMTEQKKLQEQLSKLQKQQNKIIVEMLAEHKLQLQTLNKSQKNVTSLSSKFPLKSEEDLQKVESEICDSNEEKYISAVKYLIDGSAIKNLERIFSREICVMYNTDGICGKKCLKNFKRIYKIVIAAISDYSPNSEKEFRAALQVVKKRHFRVVCSQNKNKN